MMQITSKTITGSVTSLRTKLVGALAAIAILTTLLTGSFALHYSYQSLKEQKQQDELAIARNVAVQVDEVLGKAKQTVEALALHPAILSMDAARQREALTLVTKVTELIDGIAAIDLSGRVLAMDGAEPATEGLLPPDVAHYLVDGVRRGRGSHFSEVFWNKAGEPLVAINVPIKVGAEIHGVLSGIVLLKNHSLGGIEEIRIGKSGYAYLVDGQGNVLVHPQRRRLMENLRAHPPVQALLASRLGVIEFTNQEGVPVLAAFAPIESTGWGVVVRQPTSESYAYAQHIRLVLSGVFLLSLVIALALGARLARLIANPLTDLVRGVKRVTDGDLSARLQTGGGDEISRLGSAFNEMAQRLQERIADIGRAHALVLDTERRLSRSEKLAAVGQLAAGLAHEINNPLNVMSGFCELLLDRTPPEDRRRGHVEEILRECLRCQRLVKDLLDFAKPKESRRSAVALPEMIRETLSLVRAQARGQDISIEGLVEPVPPLSADADQIKQLLLNLCLNACQAMPEGGTLRVDASVRENAVEIRVADTGHGIPRDQLKNIFNPFFTTKENGTGLGLALCHSIAESHGGSIDVESEDKRGAVFIVRLPLKEESHVLVA